MRQVSIAFALVLFTSCAAQLQQDFPSNSGGGCNSGGGGGGGAGGAGGGGGGGGGYEPTIDLHLNAPIPTNPGFPNGTYPVIDEIAASGTAEIAVQVANADLTSYTDYQQPYLAVSETPTALSVLDTAGSIVTVLGDQATGDEYVTLEIDDVAGGDVLASDDYFIAPIASVHAAPTSEIITVGDYHGDYAAHVVYPSGTIEFAIALIDDAPIPHRMIDTSLLVTGATPTGWDTAKLVGATPGHYTVTVRTGDGRVTDLDVEVVAGPDRMIVLDDNPTYVCFAAQAGDAFVAGLTWTYAVDGNPVMPDQLGPNCVYKQGLSSGTLTATAGAASLSITL